MRKLLFAPCILLLAVAQHLAAADAAQTVDLRRGVPEDVYLVVYGKHNPERDFQPQVLRRGLEDRPRDADHRSLVKIVTSRMDDGQTRQGQGR